MGKRPAETESFEGNMSVQWTRGPGMQPPVMETGLERIAAKARCEPVLLHWRIMSLGAEFGGTLWVLEDGAGVDGQTVEEAQEEFKAWVEPMLRPCTAGDIRHLPSGGCTSPNQGSVRSVRLACHVWPTGRFSEASPTCCPPSTRRHALLVRRAAGSRCPSRPRHAHGSDSGAEGELVLEADLKNFFGSLNHDWLLRFVEHRVGDPRLLSLMRRWLKAGALEDGVHQPSEEGTPQGGSISVLLSNVYPPLRPRPLVRTRGEAPSERRGIYGPLPRRLRGVQYRADALRVQGVLRKRLAKFNLTRTAKRNW